MIHFTILKTEQLSQVIVQVLPIKGKLWFFEALSGSGWIEWIQWHSSSQSMRCPAKVGADLALMFADPRDKDGELLMENRGQGKNPCKVGWT